MSKDIRIRKGLDINLVGEAEKVTVDATRSNVFAIKPDDFHGIINKGQKLKPVSHFFTQNPMKKYYFLLLLVVSWLK